MAIRGYIASSADGFIADINGGVDWLTPFQNIDLGYDTFISEIKTVVMGRKTFEHSMELAGEWPYPNQKGIVVTSRPLAHTVSGVEAWHDGVESLAQHLRTQTVGDIWIVGGVQLQTRLIELGALDRLELFVMPLFLGDGVPLFRSDSSQPKLTLHDSQSFDGGVMKLDYSF